MIQQNAVYTANLMQNDSKVYCILMSKKLLDNELNVRNKKRNIKLKE